MMSEFQELYALANRENVSINPVDPRRLTDSEFGWDVPTVEDSIDRWYLTQTLDALHMLAEGSDGRAIVMRNDIAVAMKQIVVDASAYYLLGYNSTVAVHDGKFHELRVRVKRPGLEVRHRKGYWAFSP
jgi:VWFA-related protein